MCDKAILENDGKLEPVRDCCKKQEMSNKAVDNYPHALEFLPKCYKILYPSFKVYHPYKCITQEICDEAVDDSLAALKLISDWSVTSKMIKKLFTGQYADENILYFNEDSGDAIFN